MSAAPVEPVAVRSEPPTMPATGSCTVTHPARFSDAILTKIAGLLKPGTRVLDPMAGTGRVHDLVGLAYVQTWGVELESEWARMHDRTVCYDARNIGDLFNPGAFDAIVTSPAYGNRMADQYDGRDGSRRHTYRLGLGRPMAATNGAAMQWGDPYRSLHRSIWAACVPLIAGDGVLILNCKNHIRKGEVQRVTEWHVNCLASLGLEVAALEIVQTAGLPDGENSDLRTGYEFVVVMQRPPVRQVELFAT